MIGNKHKAITNFIIENQQSCYRLAYSYVKNKEDALDVVQESICKALKAQKSLKEISQVKPWFYRILVNTAIDMYRKNKKVVSLEDEKMQVLGGFQNDSYEDIDLKNAIGELSEKDKTVIMLRFYEGMKIDDIAFLLNENVNTIKSRLYYAIGKLKIKLQGNI